MTKALFLDRDGVIIVDKHYLKDWREVEFIPGSCEAMKKAQEAGYLLFIVSNQSGVGRGLITPKECDECFERLKWMLHCAGVKVTEIYYAPEAPDQPSVGRKPSPHFVLEAIRDYDVDPEKSFFVGDRMDDLLCGKNAKLRASILVLTGKGEGCREQVFQEMPESGMANDLSHAIDMIILAES